MFKHIELSLRFAIFWILLALLERLIFVVYFAEQFKQYDWIEIWGPFYYGLRLDLSMAAYFSLLPLLGYLLAWNFPQISIPKLLLKIYILVFAAICGLITVANFNIYREWGTKINYRAIDFALNAPSEALASSSSSPILLSATVLILYFAMAWGLSAWLIHNDMPSTKEKRRIKIPVSFGLLLIAFLMIRGGWQVAPINQSMSYFSQKPLLNHASVNTFWNLFRDILNNADEKENPYRYFDEQEAKNLSRAQYPVLTEKSPEVFTSNRPNVVIIILESFTADLVESLGGEQGVAPELEQIIKQGILFENAFATGDRTDKGVTAILSAFPSQAVQSIIKSNSKQEKLPSLAQNFKQNGYRTSFYYGGESEFTGMKSYILSHDYQKLIDKQDFLSADMNSKWGAYDEKVYEKQMSDMAKEKEPFFSTILTLTNHEPFELPVKPKYKGEDLPNKFRSTAFYADSCLGAYLKAAAKQSWYKNTVFVVVADHGHRLPLKKHESWHPKRYRIPMLFFGEALKPEFRGTRIAKFGGQTDIAATLLNQLKLNSSAYVWSKDLLNPGSKDFAFFDWDNGFGWATPEQTITFDNVGKAIIYRKKNGDKKLDKALETQGKAYLQQVYQEYLDY